MGLRRGLRLLKKRKRQSRASPTPSISGCLVSAADERQHHGGNRGSRRQSRAASLLYAPGGRFVQRSRASFPTNAVGNAYTETSIHHHIPDADGWVDEPVEIEGEPDFRMDESSAVDVGAEMTERRQKFRAKKKKQWDVWLYNVVPLLVRPYLDLMRHSESLRLPVVYEAPVSPCQCATGVRTIKVACIHFQSMFFIIPHIPISFMEQVYPLFLFRLVLVLLPPFIYYHEVFSLALQLYPALQ